MVKDLDVASKLTLNKIWLIWIIEYFNNLVWVFELWYRMMSKWDWGLWVNNNWTIILKGRILIQLQSLNINI